MSDWLSLSWLDRAARWKVYIIAFLIAVFAASTLWWRRDLGSVEVAPAAAAIGVGATRQLEATVKDADGAVLPGRTVTWASSSPTVASVSVSGLVTGAAAGTATITATSEGKSGSAIVSVAQPPAALDEIKVTYSGSTPRQTWVLLRGKPAGPCEKKLLKTGSVPDFQVANMWTAPDCLSEVAVFDSGYAPLLHVDALTANAEVVTENPGPPLGLDVNLWVVADPTATDVWPTVTSILIETQTLLDSNRVGVELRVPEDNSTWKNLAGWTVPTSRLVTTAGNIGYGCDWLSTVTADPSLYDSGKLNLYVIDEISVWDAISGQRVVTPGTHEILCPDDGVHPQNVIYFSRLHHMNASLAHVLGHAFSLLKRTTGLSSLNNQVGHTGMEGTILIDGFTSTNIMWTGLDPKTDVPQTTFSLGQVYRMAFDSYSWLNWGTPRKACPPGQPASDDPCPPLALTW